MKASFMLVGIILIYVVIGYIAQETGLTAPIIEAESFVPESPDGDGGFLATISGVLAPLVWTFNAIGSLLQLAAYQGAGIPPMVNTLILAPLGLILVFTVIKLVRGTGD